MIKFNTDILCIIGSVVKADQFTRRLQTDSILIISTTAPRPAGGFVLSDYPGLNNISGTANAWCYCYGFYRAVQGTCTTFHASVNILNERFFFLNSEYIMWADCCADSAACTFIFVQFQGCDIRNVSKFFHFYISFVFFVVKTRNKSIKQQIQ